MPHDILVIKKTM